MTTLLVLASLFLLFLAVRLAYVLGRADALHDAGEVAWAIPGMEYGNKVIVVAIQEADPSLLTFIRVEDEGECAAPAVEGGPTP